MDGAALSTAASPDWRERPFLAAGELAFAGWLRVATPPGESAVSASAALASPLAEQAPQDTPARSEQPASKGYLGGAGSAAETVPAEGNGGGSDRAAPAADSSPNQDAVADAPGGGMVAAISASEDDGGANRRTLSDGSPDQAGDVARKKAGGAAGQDEGIANDSSLPPPAEFRPADGISSGGPSASGETGLGALEGEAGGTAADRPAPARDITLRLSEGDQRVDVRLVERQGEVRVEVRTPDAGLAGDLRRDLPSLAARLEQSGIRAGAWRGEPEGHRFSGSDSPGAEPDANAGQGRRESREGGDDPPRRSPQGEEQIDPKEERKEFEWFMSSHR
jgi:hypothetical protein